MELGDCLDLQPGSCVQLRLVLLQCLWSFSNIAALYFWRVSFVCRLPVTSLALIIMVVVVVLIVGGGAIGMFCINSSRRLGRSRDGLGCYRAGFDDGDAEAAAVIGPPNYWETVEEASPENSGGPTETPASTSVPMTVSIPASQLDGSNPRVQVLTRAALPQYSRLPQNDEVALLSSAQTDDDNDKDTENSSDESEAPAYVP